MALALVLALLTGLAGAPGVTSPNPASSAVQPVAVGVTLQCVAAVPLSALIRAHRDVTRIFRRVGLQIV